MKATFLCKYLVYMNKWYVINWTILFTSDLFWIGIPEWIKWFLHFADKQLILWRPLGFGDFQEKIRLNARGFAWEFLWSGILYKPGKSHKRCSKSSSVHSKKFFAWGVRVVCEWCHKWRTFRPPWPTLPGPGGQPLGGSISLKFLLETRLQSESFDTLDDLLGFQVQKLWCKLVKINIWLIR